jgi:hypothetical protein
MSEYEISADAMQQLEAAQAAMSSQMESDGPPAEIAMASSSDNLVGAAGSGRAKYLLLDHYMTSTYKVLWAYVNNAWYHKQVGTADEQGLLQVGFNAKYVDVWWDANNNITIVRCWKVF